MNFEMFFLKIEIKKRWENSLQSHRDVEAVTDERSVEVCTLKRAEEDKHGRR